MTPHSFEFTVTMPADTRLLDAVRLLAAQAAGYAKLSADAGAALADDAAREMEAAISAAARTRAPVELLFSGDTTSVSIRISCDGRTRNVHQAAGA